MLGDELTLLDGTEVVSMRGVARLTRQDMWLVWSRLQARATPETVLDGIPYYERDTALALVAGRR